MNWEPIYALLILTSTIVTYVAANRISVVKDHNLKKLYLTTSLIINFGILFLFKYYNFVTDSVFQTLNYFGIRMLLPDFELLLPVGISFYTFQAVGYTIDVYRGDLIPERHFGKYALFVSFFPQLVAGPIERATSLLPQFSQDFDFNFKRAISGTKLVIWGYFMKVVVADRLAIYVNAVYGNADSHGSATLIVATIFFAFQIYCDFGGYSNIAIGCARIMGFDLMINFRRPYFARSCTEFWQRWHISLSTWFKDYVYIPLGGNRVSKVKRYRNLMITFLVSGLWHGASWTFVIWGGLNGIYQIIFRLVDFNFKPSSYIMFERLRKLSDVLLTFVLICFSWIFFRADSLPDAFDVILRMFTVHESLFIGEIGNFIYGVAAILLLLCKDFMDEWNVGMPFEKNRTFQILRYATIVILILTIGVFDGGQFIYFQF